MKTLRWRTTAWIGLSLLAVAWFAGRTGADVEQPNAAAEARKEPASAQQVDKFIRQLGDKDYYVRQRAQDELARLGFEAFDALSAAATDDDLEIASRAKYLLRLMRVDWIEPNDPPEVKKVLRNYENPEKVDARKAVMQVLAEMPDGQGVVALCRLVRFEKSPLLSKTAAVILLSHRSAAAPPTPAEIAAVRKTLQGCKRPGAAWLLAWSRLGAEPAAVMSQWTRLVDGEQRLLQRMPNETSPEIVADLIRFQVAWLKKLGNNEAALTAIRRLVEQERGDPESLAKLIAWLIDEKAWKPIDELAKRFESHFSGEPGLLYLLAEAYAGQGATSRAEETAKRALALFPDKQEEQLYRHYRMARLLQVRGLFAWSRREFEHVIGQDREAEELTVEARTRLAEMLHDQGQELDAASTLEKLLAAIDAGKVTKAQLQMFGRTPKEIRSRTYYFFACHWETKHDASKQRAYLDKALAADPEDVDVLIAFYRLPGQKPKDRAKIVDLIKTAAAALHEEVGDDPDTSSACNQYAWLIGNTEGDFDEALRCAQKALELQPEEPAYLDTLAHVCFGKGDFANAVKYQAKALEHDPHSAVIRNELARFRKKLEETKK